MGDTMPQFLRSSGISVFVTMVVILTAGCSQISEKITDLLRKPTLIELNSRLTELSNHAPLNEVDRKGSSYIASYPEFAPELHRTLGEIYLSKGDAEGAVRHLQQSGPAFGSNSGNSATPAPRHTQTPSPVPSTQVRGQSDLQNPPPTRPNVSVGAAVDGASAVIGDNGIEVRAGNAVAVLPK
jgi:hypothetical protein